MAATRKTGFDLFPDYFKKAVIAMCTVSVMGAAGVGLYTVGINRPAPAITSDSTTFAEGTASGASSAASQEEGKESLGEKGSDKGSKTGAKPAFGAGTYTVTTPSGLNVREGAGIGARRTGGKVRGSGVEIVKTKLVEGDTWGQLRSGGWIAMEFNGHKYVVSDRKGAVR